MVSLNCRGKHSNFSLLWVYMFLLCLLCPVKFMCICVPFSAIGILTCRKVMTSYFPFLPPTFSTHFLPYKFLFYSSVFVLFWKSVNVSSTICVHLETSGFTSHYLNDDSDFSLHRIFQQLLVQWGQKELLNLSSIHGWLFKGPCENSV